MHGRSQRFCPPAASRAKLSGFGPPKSSCINCEQLRGGFPRDLGLLHTLVALIPGEIPSWCDATRNCRGVLPEIQLQARPRGLVGSSGLGFKSCVEFSQVNAKSFSPGAGAQGHLGKAWVGG